jgi:hypothetical protein
MLKPISRNENAVGDFLVFMRIYLLSKFETLFFSECDYSILNLISSIPTEIFKLACITITSK